MAASTVEVTTNLTPGGFVSQCLRSVRQIERLSLRRSRMFWWYDPSRQRITNTHAFTSNVKNPGYFTIWPMFLPEWWTRGRIINGNRLLTDELGRRNGPMV